MQDDGAPLVEDAQVHCPGVQIDSAVEFVRLLIEAHHGLLWHGSGSLSPHRGWKAPTFLKLPPWAKTATGLEPLYLWDRPRPIPNEAMISIQTLQM